VIVVVFALAVAGLGGLVGPVEYLLFLIIAVVAAVYCTQKILRAAGPGVG
jgi:hypothetical protein